MIPSPESQDDRTPLLGRCARTVGGVAFVAALTLGGAGLATAEPADDGDLERTTLSSGAQEGAVEYWTAERMESATPADELIADQAAPDGQVAASATESIPAVGADSEVRTAQRSASGAVDAAQPAAGTDHIGKVFFTVEGVDYVCSGNAVASSNGSTVSTAGHCVHEAGTWADNWVFAPGYAQGSTPYGLWGASDLYATDQWVATEDMNYDVAFAIVEPESGAATLTEAVGGSGIEFNTERGALYTSYGYPAGAPFDGESLEQCQGQGVDDTIGGTDDQGIDCDMTGGSSGGPWFAGDGPSGMQVSVNSFGYSSQPNVMYGPYLGDVAQEIYEAAAAA
ncbi:trypsin-like serine peptidase [Brachybacterium sacelli]|uniref:V8-like Glu-specific endopeptidase n=1 Tax=Brachybacterium sacelli TaxID=173364 RepID=A0ABS4X632_9MICO|nr:trypsin-like peptidase domain-containing protein [Brachybacterium sacelli]MBP2383922.1 V8-like Glu-specific endopeptidase [Brachybacterium sacelli]